MAHLVALDEKRDPLPKGLEPRPLDEAEEDETFLSLVEVIVAGQAGLTAGSLSICMAVG